MTCRTKNIMDAIMRLVGKDVASDDDRDMFNEIMADLVECCKAGDFPIVDTLGIGKVCNGTYYGVRQWTEKPRKWLGTHSFGQFPNYRSIAIMSADPHDNKPSRFVIAEYNAAGDCVWAATLPTSKGDKARVLNLENGLEAGIDSLYAIC